MARLLLERDGRALMKRIRSTTRRLALAGLVAALGWAPAPASADSIAISTGAAETLGGLSVTKGDAALYDTGTGTAAPFFLESAFSGAAQLDAFEVLPNGHYVLSTGSGETLGGLSFQNGDLVEYDPGMDTAVLLLDQSDFDTGSVDIDAVSILPNGHIVLSTVGSETLAGLSFGHGDLVEYDPVNLTASVLFDQSLLSGNTQVDGADVLADGRILLSTSMGSTLAGLSFVNGDVVLYDPVAQTASLFLAEADIFAGNAQVDALAGVDLSQTVSVPEPGALPLLGLVLVGLAALRRS